MDKNQTDNLIVTSAEIWLNRSYRGGLLTVVILSALYALSPVDLIPDVLLGIGQADDLAVLFAGGSSAVFMTILRSVLLAFARRGQARYGCAMLAALAMVIVMAGIVTFMLVVGVVVKSL